jgi:glutamate-ammonia-ligase adenylyltransferase
LDRSTLGALDRFVRYRLLSPRDRDDLRAAYLFLRNVEHKLQMVLELQTHALPDTGEELERCAVRVGYDTEERSTGAARFRQDHQHHTALVNRLFRSFFYDPGMSRVLKATLRLCRRR